MKIHINFEIRKKLDAYLMKIQISFMIRKKKSDLYLMKIQISFVIRKKNQICKYRSILSLEKKTDLKIQISFEFREKNQI